jgi:hypothetical protein
VAESKSIDASKVLDNPVEEIKKPNYRKPFIPYSREEYYLRNKAVFELKDGVKDFDDLFEKRQ